MYVLNTSAVEMIKFVFGERWRVVPTVPANAVWNVAASNVTGSSEHSVGQRCLISALEPAQLKPVSWAEVV
jgi:hypothetical protein